MIQDLYWHDGILENVGVALGMKHQATEALTLAVSLYPTEDAKKRTLMNLNFLGVSRLSINCDLNELKDNRGAGNISNGYVKQSEPDGENVFRLYLVDGYIELACKDMTLSAQ